MLWLITGLIVSFFSAITLAGQTHFVPKLGTPVLVDDFNGDGNIDVVSSYGMELRFYIYAGKSNGQFNHGAPCYQQGMRSQRILSADLNGDGFKDFAVLQGEWIFLFPGSKQATCGRQTLLRLERFAASEVVVGDFEGKGERQLLAIDSYNGRVRLLRSKTANLIFQPESDSTLGFTQVGQALVVKAADGSHDELLALDPVKGLVHVYELKAGRFKEVSRVVVGAYPFSMAAADLAGTGVTNLMVALRSPNSLKIFARDENGQWKAEAKGLNLGASPVSIDFGDFNDDGSLDILVAEDFNPQAQLFLQKDGKWQLRATAGLMGTPRSVKVLDFNHDGKLDFIVATPLGVDLVTGKGDGSF